MKKKMKKRPNVTRFISKTNFNKEFTKKGNKLGDTTNLVKKTDLSAKNDNRNWKRNTQYYWSRYKTIFNAKVTEIENKKTNVSNLQN